MISCALVNFGSGNGLSPVRGLVITWTNTDLWLGYHKQISKQFSTKIQTFSAAKNAFEFYFY